MGDSDGYERDEIDDIIDASGSDTSITRSTTASSIASSMFDRNHFVLELHKLQKEETVPERRPDSRIRKLKKKLRASAFVKRSKKSDSSESDGDCSDSPSVTDNTIKEQFFDAHESYYGLPAKGTPEKDSKLPNFLKLRGTNLNTDHAKPDNLPRLPAIEIPQSIGKQELEPISHKEITKLIVNKAFQIVPQSIEKQILEGIDHRNTTRQTEPMGTIESTDSFYMPLDFSSNAEPQCEEEFLQASGMEKSSRYKVKNKKSTGKPKPSKKRKSDGPTCSMFLAELTRKLASKKKHEEESPKNIVHTIIESITNALPIKFFKKRIEVQEPPLVLENLQNYAPELLPNDKIEILHVGKTTDNKNEVEDKPPNIEQNIRKTPFKVPKMPVVNSEVFKHAVERNKKTVKEDAGVNTGNNVSNDVAVELAKHVNTLKKISLIAEEFNKKTAKNLKEIVDSVQEELLKKLEVIQAEQALESSKNNEPTQKP